MPNLPTVIKTPCHVHPGVQTEADYRARQAEYLARMRQMYAHLGDVVVHAAPAPAEVFVSGGKWVVECPCGNCPSVHPDWRLALCFECGAVYEDVEVPLATRAIELCLVARQSLAARYWNPALSTLDLLATNAAIGLASMTTFDELVEALTAERTD